MKEENRILKSRNEKLSEKILQIEREQKKKNNNELIKSLDDEIELLESLLIEDADLNSLLSNIKNKKEEKEKLYIKN